MAYRRNQAGKKEGEVKRSCSFSNPSSLSPFATQAIHASFAHSRDAHHILKQDSTESESQSKSGFWGILARKAKAILEEEEEDVSVSTRIESPVSAPAASTAPLFDSPAISKTHHRNLSHGHDPNPNTTSRLSKGLRSISTSVKQDPPIKEGPTPVVNKATDIQHERKSPTIRGSRGAGSPHERESPTPRRNKGADIPRERESRTPRGTKGADIPRERESCTPRGTKGADIQHECEVRAPVANKAADNLPEREARSPTGTKASDILVGRKLQIRKKGNGFDGKGPTSPGVSGTPTGNSSRQLGGMFSTQIQNNENQLKASRDVAMATAAKAKLLLRELKTVKADLAFAKERCSQLEEENKVLRCRVKGANHHNTHADDDLIRLQLETLLAEKARLANENSTYARENRFLREIVEYHQLTMQDIVYFDEYDEEEYDAEVSIHKVSKMLTVSPPSPSEDPLSIPPPEISAPSSPLEYPLSIPNPSENQNLDVSANNLVQESGDASSPSVPSSD